MRKILFLLLLASSITVAQEQIKVDVSNPNATIFTHLHFLQTETYEPKKSAKSLYGLSEEEAVDKAIKIKKVLDGKGLFVDFSIIPNNPSFTDTIGYVKKFKYVLFPDRMPLISVEKVNGNWYYSQETVRNIDALYESTFPWHVQKIQKLIPSAGQKKLFGIKLWQYILLVILFVLAILMYYVVRVVSTFLLHTIQYKITKSNNQEIKTDIKKLAHPISLLIGLSVIDELFPSLQFSLNVNQWVFLGINIVSTVFWIYLFLKLVQVIMRIYAELAKRTHGKLDDQLVPILHNFLTGIVVFLGILKLLTLFGVDGTTVIAGASIGGLAVALASQDTVKNLIGTLMIFLDKPFHIGDWIQTDSLSGEVEEVGFRSTRVRGADTSIFQIPNSKLSEIVINNQGLRRYRRYKTTLGIRYDTPPELIEAFVNGIKKLIVAHPDIRVEPNSYNVELTGFGDSALLIMVNVYLKSNSWAKEQSSKHQLHMAILKLANILGVQFAFPSSTVMVEQFPDKNSVDLAYNINVEDINASINKVVDNFTKNQH